MSRADFERGWRCAVAEVARKLRAADGAGVLLLVREAVDIAEDARPNLGAQRGEAEEVIALLTSPEGLRAALAPAKLVSKMKTGGQVEEFCGTLRLTPRGRAELIDD